MINLSYQIKDSKDRKSVDLRGFKNDLISAINSARGIRLLKVGQDFYTIEIDTDKVKNINRVVRKLGRRIAQTDLKFYVKHRGKSKDGISKNELFIRIKKLTEKQLNSEYHEIKHEPTYDPFYDPSK